jgi:DNA-binding transcriptional regulator WhiA/DNA-binding CsgD family transcriptional regulator
MPAKWKPKEEQAHRAELERLYIVKNLSIREISNILNIAQQTVFQRLQRLGVPINPQKKQKYQNRRSDIRIPKRHTPELAELFGILLGDGHISHFQVLVTLGTKEQSYAEYVVRLMQKLFGATPRISIRRTGYRDVYLGSVRLTKWLLRNGFVQHKVRSQVDIPEWVIKKRTFSERFIRGFFDTDGSIYRLRYGTQISLSNRSMPLLTSLRKMLDSLGYRVSRISAERVYITHSDDIARFFRELQPQNPKHVMRFRALQERLNQERAGVRAVK